MTDIQFYFVVLIDIFYYGRGLGHTFGVRVDGPLARGFLRFLSLTAFQAEGCGLPLCGNAYKVSVTGFTFSVIWQNKHSADWLAALATPYPGCAGLPPVQQCYSVKRFTQAYVITTCAFFVSKKSLGLQKNIKTSKKGLTNPQKFEAPPVSKGTAPIVNKEDLL